MPIIPPELDPLFLQNLKAKSADEHGYQQTLAEHTWLVLARLADQHRLHANGAVVKDNGGIWNRLYWACFFHDFGKAAKGFQERLQKNAPENKWAQGKHRHEVLSLAFVDWLFPSGHEDRLTVIGAIISHHKDSEEIFGKYGGGGKRKQEQDDRIAFLMSQINPPVIEDLYHWLSEYGLRWHEKASFPVHTLQPTFVTPTTNSIIAALAEFSDYLLPFEDGKKGPLEIMREMLTRGLILTADHAASAGVGEFPPMPPIRHPIAPEERRSHQEHAQEARAGSAILIAPTGSGKTEAALLWSACQHKHRPTARLFYTLPYQASMNAMYERLAEKFFGVEHNELAQNPHVGIQHSRATLKLYQLFREREEGTLTAKATAEEAKRLRNMTKLNAYPVQVFSPYQMLKAAYQLKGYEPLLLDYTDALFIFDEIHAYEPKRLALIIEFIGWLRENFGARFLVMTATLPNLIREKLMEALGEDTEIIEASAEDFEAARRHDVYLLEGNLRAGIVERVVQDIKAGKRVLVCCNRIADAQEVYENLKKAWQDRLSGDDIILLHGRFNGKDRGEKEKKVKERAGVGEEKRGPVVVVATQVVEVSLDVDFDTLYTDPAPLEALLQRFGRVNRRRGSYPEVPCQPVYVFRDVYRDERKDPFLPYAETMVARAIEVLDEQGDGSPIDEARVSTMLDAIYQDTIREQWDEEYRAAAKEFQDAILGKMKPYQSADEAMWHSFYKMFDGTQVLPANCENEFYDRRDEGDYIGAMQYLVNLSWQQYAEFKKYGLIKPAEEKEFADHITVDYDSELGLQLDKARQEHKMKQEDNE